MLFEVGIMVCYESCYCIKFMKKLDEGQRLLFFFNKSVENLPDYTLKLIEKIFT